MALHWSDSLDDVDWHELVELYRLAPLGQKDATELRTAFGNSRYRCLVRDAGRLVGAGRAVADGIEVSYLADIAVLPGYQGSGLGKQIVARLIELSAGHKRILLYAVPGKEPFYRRFGFLRMTTAMAIMRDPAQALSRGYLTKS